MTRQQLKNSGKLMKKSCMPKNDVTEGKIKLISYLPTILVGSYTYIGIYLTM